MFNINVANQFQILDFAADVYESLLAWNMTRIQPCFVDGFQRDLFSAYLNSLSRAGVSITSKYKSSPLVTPKVDN